MFGTAAAAAEGKGMYYIQYCRENPPTCIPSKAITAKQQWNGAPSIGRAGFDR